MITAKKKSIKSDDDQNREWREKFGKKGAKAIWDSMNANVED